MFGGVLFWITLYYQQTPAAATKPPVSFAVALRADGSVDKLADKTLEEYLAFTKDASVAWIDYSTKDLDKEIEKIAATMGFTQTPIQKMLTGFYSAYEDTDTELGIMLPAVTMSDMKVTVRPLFILIRANFIMTMP